MNIPDEIKIGGHVLKIKIREYDEGFTSSGRIHSRQGFIILNSDLIQTKKISTLIHEAIHEICWQAEIELTETITSVLAEGLYQILSDNKFLKE